MTTTRKKLTELQSGANFIPRHIGPRDDDVATMLQTVGANSLDDLIDKVIPADLRMEGSLDLPQARM